MSTKNGPLRAVQKLAESQTQARRNRGRNPLADYTARSRRVTKTSGTVVGICTGTSLAEAPCGLLGALCCSFLPGLCAYKCSASLGCAPRYVGPYVVGDKANRDQAGTDLEKLSVC